jgi:hypothetical protein
MCILGFIYVHRKAKVERSKALLMSACYYAQVKSWKNSTESRIRNQRNLRLFDFINNILVHIYGNLLKLRTKS